MGNKGKSTIIHLKKMGGGTLVHKCRGKKNTKQRRKVH